MSARVDPDKIFSDYRQRKISKSEVVDRLNVILQNSENDSYRLESIEHFVKLDFESEAIYKILEDLLLSDENALIRSSAASAIFTRYMSEGYDSLRWTIRYDSSPLVLKMLFDHANTHQKEEISQLQEDIKDWYQKFSSKIGVASSECPFLVDVEASLAVNKPERRIDNDTYRFYRALPNLNPKKPWLVLEEAHIVQLKLNYYYWYILKENVDIIDSFSVLNDLNSYFEVHKKYNAIFRVIRQVPKTINLLCRLKSLDLSDNDLESIPESIGTIKSIKELDLSRNKIQGFSNSLKNFFLALDYFNR